MQSLLAFAICTLAVTAVAHKDKLKVPVGVLYRKGEEEIVKSIESAFSKERHDNFSIKIIEQSYELSTQIHRRVCSLLAKGITVLVASTPFADTSNFLVSISNNYHLPFINLLDSEFTDRKSHFKLSMMMNTEKASSDTISFYGWKSAIYVRDKFENSENILQFLQEMNFDSTLNNIVYQLPETILEYMEDLPKDFKQLNVVLNVPLETIYDILPILLTKYDERIAHFLITRPVTQEFWKKPFLENINSKITAFSMLNKTEPISKLFSRFEEYKTEEPFLAFDAGKVIFEALKQLHNTNSSFIKEISVNNTKHISNCKIRPSVPWIHGLSVARALKEVQNCHGFSGNVQFDSLGRRRIYTLHIIEFSHSETRKIGSWSDKTGLTLNEPVVASPEKFPWFMASKPEEKQRKTFVITSILMEPYLMKNGDSYTGFCKDLIDILSAKLNFDYRLKIVDDGQFGSYNHSNKKWTGMIGEIISEKADLAVAPLIATSERSKVVSFTTPFQYGGITLLAKKVYSSPSFLLFRPFSWEVWIFVLIVYVIFGTFLLSVSYYTSESLEKSQLMHHEKYYNSVTQKFLCARSWIKSIGKLICFVFTIALLSLYIAKLSSIITSEENSYASRELLPTKEMFQYSVTTGFPKMLVLRGSTTMKYFQKSGSLLYSQYWKQIQENSDLFVSSYSEALERLILSDGDTVFLLESPIAEYISNVNCNSFTTLAGTLNTQTYSIAMGSTFSLRLNLSNQIMVLQENGILNKLYDKWWSNYSDCDESNVQRITYKMNGGSLRFRDICGLFYLMIFSSVIIVVLSVSQFLCQKYQKYSQEIPKSVILT
ncbi:glutamate receptor 1-like isoform X2 [Centruroides vittatus]|uniref:glutamate receptor 1-like isoform X2 n=1 Tax=Centruroides vittatus TaxID=120091 RepID=UPI00350F9E14